MALKVEIMPAGCGKKWDDQSLGQVVGIVVHYDPVSLLSLRFIYVNNDNIGQQQSKTYGTIGGKCEMIVLDYPTEFFIGVHGTYLAEDHIRCITFVTNKATYGPFGKQRDGTPVFDFKFVGNGHRKWISGFYGTLFDGRIESLGVYVQTTTASQLESFQSEKPKIEL